MNDHDAQSEFLEGNDVLTKEGREVGLLADALAYADMHSAPDGQLINPERRLADIIAGYLDPDDDGNAAVPPPEVDDETALAALAGKGKAGAGFSKVMAPASRAI